MHDELARIPEDVACIAHAVANEAFDRGGSAIVLAGSHARGDAQPESDVDLYVIGDGPDYRLQRRGQRLVSVSWRTADAERAALYEPSLAGAVVPGWRNALIVLDPQGIAAALRREAIGWDWQAIGSDALNGWVAEDVTGFAEEVHKLVASVRSGNVTVASVQRSILALRLARPMSVHTRLLYETENRLWELVGREMGEAWQIAQSIAFGETGDDHAASCHAALALYRLAGAAVWSLLDARQREVVEHAMRLELPR
jgi:hypothetical protein